MGVPLALYRADAELRKRVTTLPSLCSMLPMRTGVKFATSEVQKLLDLSQLGSDFPCEILVIAAKMSVGCSSFVYRT